MAFLGLLLYVFSFLIRPADWWPPTLGWPIDFAILATTALLILLTFNAERWRAVLGLPHVRFLELLLVWILLSDLSKGNLDAAIQETIRFVKYLFISLLIIYLVDSCGKLKAVLLLMISLVAVMGLQGIDQLRDGVGWAGQPVYWGNRISWVGPFDGANILAVMFVISVPFLLAFVLGPWGWAYKFFALATGYWIGNGLILTNSRGGYLSFLVVVGLFPILSFRRSVGLALGAVMLVGLLAIAPSRFGEIDDKEKSSRGRVNMWSEALEMVRYNPIAGIGKGQFSKYTGSLLAHNAFLQNLGETGLVGTFVWLNLVYVTLRSLRCGLAKEKDRSRERHSLTFCLFLGLCGLLVGLLFISADFEMQYIWIALCAAMSLLSDAVYRATRTDYVLIAASEVGGVTLAYVAVNAYKVIFS